MLITFNSIGYVYISKICFDFLKRIIPHTSSAAIQAFDTSAVCRPSLALPPTSKVYLPSIKKSAAVLLYSTVWITQIIQVSSNQSSHLFQNIL